MIVRRLPEASGRAGGDGASRLPLFSAPMGSSPVPPVRPPLFGGAFQSTTSKYTYPLLRTEMTAVPAVAS